MVSATSKPSKKVLTALERVFAAEIDGMLPFQSKAAVFKDLLAEGLVERCSRRFGSGWSALVVSGYEMTHAGRPHHSASRR